MELGFQHPASHRFLTLFKFPCLEIIFSQLTTEDFLTADELGWFPGSLVLGQVLGILLGPLLADLVNSLLKMKSFCICVLCACRWAEDSRACLRLSPPLPPGFFSQPGSPGLLLLLQIFLILFSTSQLGWTLLLGRTLTGLTDSLVT